MKMNCEYICYGSFNGPLCPPSSTPVPRPTTLNFTNSRIGLREQPVLKDLFDIFYGGNGFDYDLNIIVNEINNENFNNNGCYYPTKYPTPIPAPAPLPTIEFNCINTGLPGIDILKGVYGVVWNENNSDNEIYNCMILFCKIFFVVVLFEFVNLNHLNLF